MKYIKYFEAKVSPGGGYSPKRWPKEVMDNLSDCLQEVFDKFHIIEWSSDKPEILETNWRNFDNVKINISSIPKHSNKLTPIYNEISRITPMIEKRIGYQIDVSLTTDYSYEYQINISPKSKIRTSLFSKFIKRFK